MCDQIDPRRHSVFRYQ